MPKRGQVGFSGSVGKEDTSLFLHPRNRGEIAFFAPQKRGQVGFLAAQKKGTGPFSEMGPVPFFWVGTDGWLEG
jgi:hypothetical protein